MAHGSWERERAIQPREPSALRSSRLGVLAPRLVQVDQLELVDGLDLVDMDGEVVRVLPDVLAA
eukprot:5696640-Alexandrium_andersonii.AAC.1